MVGRRVLLRGEASCAGLLSSPSATLYLLSQMFRQSFEHKKGTELGSLFFILA